MSSSPGHRWQDTHYKTYLAMELSFFPIKSYMKLNCVENEQVSYFQLNFLSKAKLITFANHAIDEKHIFVYLCTCGGCTCTYVHMCLDAGVDMAVFLNHSLFVSQGLSLNLELTD